MESHDRHEHPADAPQLFAFEQPSCEDYTFIPLSVRFHLDRCGWRLSLVQWQALPYADRVRLAACPVSEQGAPTTSPFDALLTLLAARDLREPVERMPPMQPMPGDDVSQVPDSVQAQCGFADLATLATAQWAALSPFQRYALAKLSRKPKANHDFLPALREFGLAS